MVNPSWTEYYMAFAHLAAVKSKDSTQVGAVLVGPDGEIRLSGYNGPPRGVNDLPERRDEFIIGKGLWDQFKEASHEAK